VLLVLAEFRVSPQEEVDVVELHPAEDIISTPTPEPEKARAN
jgi:hypothetical protein